MTRSPSTIGLAIVSAVLIVVGRLNQDASWGLPVLIAGFVVLVVAGVLAFRTRT
jgi:hypothetical protein